MTLKRNYPRGPLSALAIALAMSATAGGSVFAVEPAKDKASGLNVPPQELTHPEQFGIEDFGNRSTAAALASQNTRTDAVALDTTGPIISIAAKALALPTTISNGNFSSGAAGWQGFMRGNWLDGIADTNGPTIVSNLGLGAPAGAPVLKGDAFNPTGTPRCASYGEMWQDIHVTPGAKLRFHWQPGYSGTSLFGEGTLQFALKDPYSNRVLWDVTPLNYAQHSGGRYTEVDLSAYAGLDVRLRFASSPRPDLGAHSCYNWTWFDNVAIFQGPINYASVNPTPGIWYNRFRDGGGWDLRKMPDGGYYGIWYTFEGGNPTWYYLDPGYISNGSFNTNIRKMVRTGSNVQQEIVGRVNLRMLSTSSALMSFDFYNYPNGAGAWDNTESLQLLTAGGANAYNGFWHTADNADPNWGLTTTSYSGGNLFSTQYFYDPSGQPTWTFAQGAFSGNGTLDVKKTTGGFCPNCAGSYPALVRTSVGSLQMSLAYPGSVSMQATFNAGSWQRPSRTYYKLTD